MYKKQIIIVTRQTMHAERNNETRSSNHCCSVKAIGITYADCVFSLRYPACNARAPCCHL